MLNELKGSRDKIGENSWNKLEYQEKVWNYQEKTYNSETEEYNNWTIKFTGEVQQ